VSLGGWQTRGQFGDLFGEVNAFFTGLAFAGLVFTILLQGYHLRSQGEELSLSTELSANAALADIYTRQIDVMERGDFRGELWKAERKLHCLATGGSDELSAVEAREARDEVIKTADPRYIAYIKSKSQGNSLFRPSFELWRLRHRQLDDLLDELEGMRERLERMRERHEEAPPGST
jgi:hypothetical protein